MAGHAFGTVTVDTDPADQTECAGDAAVFTVAASTDDPALTYQWEWDSGGGFVALVNGGDISGVTTTTLTILNVETADAAGPGYRCVVNDNGGVPVNSFTATLTVQGAPTANAAADQTVCDVDTVQLAGVATNDSVTIWSTPGDGSFDDPTLLDAVYTPGANDLASGVTLMLTVVAQFPCVGAVQDSMNVSIQDTETVDAGVDQNVCDVDTVQLAGSATDAASTAWTTSGDGTFDNAALLNAVYTPGAADITAGTVTLTLTANATAPCTGSSVDTMVVTIDDTATVSANVDQTICEVDTVTLAGSATDASSTLWSTGGDGTFDDASLLNAVYTPGATDLTNGTVTLTLTANSTAPCAGSVNDTMTVTIAADPTADASADQSICDGDTVTLAGATTNSTGCTWTTGGAVRSTTLRYLRLCTPQTRQTSLLEP